MKHPSDGVDLIGVFYFNMKTNIEIWKDVKGYEGIYQCSSFGRIKTVERYITEINGKKRIRKEIIRKQCLCKNGYYYITLNVNMKIKQISVHRIVASTFLPLIMNKNVVNHKNGIKTDNRIENLEWCNKSENELHAYRVLGKINIAKGSSNFIKRKKVSQYDLNGNYINTYDSIVIASIETKTNRKKISDVCNGKRFKTNNYIWKHE